MHISLMQISLLPLFKTFHKYLPYANFGLFISLVQFLGKIFGCVMRFFGYLFHYWVIMGHVTQNVEFLFQCRKCTPRLLEICMAQYALFHLISPNTYRVLGSNLRQDKILLPHYFSTFSIQL